MKFITHNYKRYEGESDEELIYRITGEKDNIGSWQQVADILNDLLGTEYTESKFRKQRQAFDKMLSANQRNFADNFNQIEEIRQERRELEKERVRLRDERNEYKRLIREEARKENFADMVKRIIQEETKPIATFDYHEPYYTEYDLLCHLTDIHTGNKISNFKNQFNEEILRERLEKFTNQILFIKNTHEARDCYLVIGEILSGIIHNTLRIQNNLDLIEQFKYISELITTILLSLSEHFNHVYVYVTPGNHSRITPKKEDSIVGENMDILLPFYLQARLQNIENVSIMDNAICQDIAMFSIRGTKVFASHGDKDSLENVVQNYTMLFGMKPDIVLLGHRHTNGMKTVSDVKVIQSGCVSGTDEYALSRRMSNKPEQTVSVIGDNGLVCLYDLKLD